ncbi:MAG: DUF4870 domain-containing protein [Acidobacteriia bacterium]|nr:DUF4870 domain-containing protein [Terriglobia bacterium]
MAKFCTGCGTQLDDAIRFCTKCGAAVGGAQGPQAAPPSPQYQSAPQNPGAPAGAGLEANVAGMLCYLAGFITGIIFLVIEPHNKNRFVRFHAFQSIFFSVVWIVFSMICSFFIMALPFGLWFVGSLLHLIIWLGGFLLWLFLMYKAYNNEMFKLPVIGDIAMKQAG